MQKEVMKQALDLMSGKLKEEIKINLENPRDYTRLFVKILEKIKDAKKESLELTALKNAILKINKENYSKITEQSVSKTPSALNARDIEYWLERAKKGDSLIYYTGATFDERSPKEEAVFKKVRNLAMDYDNIPKKGKKYQYRVSIKGEWGCNYRDIVTLVQKKVAKEQRDTIWDEDKKEYVPGNIISYPIYNYKVIKT
jgi:hypothetical protein